MANKINQIEIDSIIYDLQDKDAKAPFTGTKAEVQAAIAAGEIKEGDIVNITDDIGDYPGGGDIPSGVSNIVYLTQEQYDALPDDKLTDDIEYRITDEGTDTNADNVGYNNIASGLSAMNVQDAIDELSSRPSGGGGDNIVYLTQEAYDALSDDKLTNNVEYRITDVGVNDAMASNIAYDNSESGIAALNVQGAIDKVNSDLNKLNLDLGGLKFGTDGEGNVGYFGADGSLIPFSVGGIEEAICYTADFTSSTTSETYTFEEIDKIEAVIILYEARGMYIAAYVNNEIVLKSDDAVSLSVDGNSFTFGYSGTQQFLFKYFVFGSKVSTSNDSTSKPEVEIVPLVPTLTSNTGSDGGEASVSDRYSADYDAWRAFDGNSSGNDWLTSGAQSDSFAWIKYKFTVPTIVRKVSYVAEGNFVFDVILQGSNDDSNWYDIGKTVTLSMSPSKEEHEFNVENNTAYMYYRLYCTNSTHNTNKKYYGLYELQFYGYQMEALVPVMTNNTSSAGSVSASEEFNSSWVAWQAFDGNTDTGWLPGDQHSGWLQYQFNGAKKVEAIKLSTIRRVNPTDVPLYLEASNGNDEWIILKEFTTADTGMHIIKNNNSYIYYRLRTGMLSQYSTGYIGIGELQFYAAPKGISNGEINISSINDFEVFKEFTNRFPSFLLNDVSGGFRIESDIFKKMKNFTFSCKIGSHAGYYLRYYDNSNVIQNLDGNNVKAAGEYTFTVDCSKAADVTQDVFFIFTHTYAKCESFKVLSYELL